jgi:hypothetical protein
MDHARFSLALPDDPDVLGRARRPERSADLLARTGQTVIAFESITPPMMLRGRVIQALEVAVGPECPTPAFEALAELARSPPLPPR